MSTGTKRGFTITELLVVISIIGVLAALSLPALNYAFMAADKMTCTNNLGELGKACIAYDGDKGNLPQIRDALISRQTDDGSWSGKGSHATPMAIIILATPHRYIPIYQR